MIKGNLCSPHLFLEKHFLPLVSSKLVEHYNHFRHSGKEQNPNMPDGHKSQLSSERCLSAYFHSPNMSTISNTQFFQGHNMSEWMRIHTPNNEYKHTFHKHTMLYQLVLSTNILSPFLFVFTHKKNLHSCS